MNFTTPAFYAQRCPALNCTDWSAFKCAQIDADIYIICFVLLIVGGLLLCTGASLLKDGVRLATRTIMFAAGVSMFFFGLFMLWGLGFG